MDFTSSSHATGKAASPTFVDQKHAIDTLAPPLVEDTLSSSIIFPCLQTATTPGKAVNGSALDRDQSTAPVGSLWRSSSDGN